MGTLTAANRARQARTALASSARNPKSRPCGSVTTALVRKVNSNPSALRTATSPVSGRAPGSGPKPKYRVVVLAAAHVAHWQAQVEKVHGFDPPRYRTPLVPPPRWGQAGQQRLEET